MKFFDYTILEWSLKNKGTSFSNIFSILDMKLLKASYHFSYLSILANLVILSILATLTILLSLATLATLAVSAT